MPIHRKKTFVSDLREGDKLEDLFLVKAVKMGETRAGKPYLVLTVMDRSGEISGPVWDNAEEAQALCPPGQVIGLTGSVQSYRERPQLKVDHIFRYDQSLINPADYHPASSRDTAEMIEELQALVRSVKNAFLRKLLLYFFDNSEYWLKFQTAPAAKGMHHAYIGGLLEHSISVAKATDLLASHYAGVDRSLLLTGALLHDIGKLEELNMENGVIDYTVRGRLKGHLVIGSEMVAQAAASVKDFPDDLLEQVQHLILSHHGKHEFGSPTLPMTVEAFMLSFLDDLDAKMNITEQLRRKMDSVEPGWTDYQRSLERYLYLGGFEGEKQGPAGEMVQNKESAHNGGRQPTLF